MHNANFSSVDLLYAHRKRYFNHSKGRALNGNKHFLYDRIDMY